MMSYVYRGLIEYEIFGEGSQFSTNQKRESTVSWLLIGRNLMSYSIPYFNKCLVSDVCSIAETVNLSRS